MKTFIPIKTTGFLHTLLTILLIIYFVPESKGQRVFGTGQDGGPKGGGTIFSMNPNGDNFTIEHAFELPISGPIALAQGMDGNYYGTNYGGIYGQGAISRYAADGTEVQVLHYFEGGEMGGQPFGQLIQDEDGNFYGFALGGQTDDGILYRFNSQGGFTILHHFNSATAVGGNPRDGVTLGSDGRLYGTTGSSLDGFGAGAFFVIDRDGTGLTTFREFEGFGNGSPSSKFYEGPDGLLYGLLDYDNALFRISPDGSNFETLGNLDSSLQLFSMVNHPDNAAGILYALAIQGFAGGETKIYKIDTETAELELLYSMESPQSADNRVDSGLLIDSDGFLYWLTRTFRANSQVFRFDPDSRALTVFSHLESSNGFINATTIGFNNSGDLFGAGSIREKISTLIFKLDLEESTPSIVYEKTIEAPFGPNNRLLESSFGKLYGTAAGGKGVGTIFGINADGTGFTVLRNLDSNEDGAYPTGLIEGSDGHIYGVNSGGGVHLGGTIFKMSPDGSDFSALRHIHPELDGGNINGQLVEGPNGLLYGLARDEGPEGFGSLFSISKEGDFNVVYAFSEARAGRSPNGSLTLGQDGRLYGFTTEGARNRKGTIFSIGLDGRDLQVLYETPFRDQGMFPIDHMVEGDPGIFYGVMVTGPDDFFSFLDYGLVFKLTVEDLNFEILQTFVVEEDGVPDIGLAIDNQGNLYGGTDINFQPYDPITQSGVVFKLSAGDYNYEILRRLNESTDGKGVTGVSFIKGDLPDCIEIKLGDLIIDPDKRAPVGKTVRPHLALPSGEIKSATWHWGNGQSSPATIDNGVATGTFRYEEAGLYRISLEVESGCGENTLAEADPYPIFDPEAGAVAGAGWFHSPQGAYIPRPNSSGKAFFSLSARYHRHSKTPSGHVGLNTRDFKFNSSYLNWLVIEEDKAVIQGVGKLNGKGNYGFLLASAEGTSTTKVRMKIWDRNRGDQLVYDSDINAPWDAMPELLAQGTVTVLEGSKRKGQPSHEELFAELLKKIKAYPNPTVDKIYVDLGDLSPELITTILTDAYGNLELRDLHQLLENNILEFNVSRLRKGTYYIQVRTEYGYHSVKVLKR
ncbi:T9SS type A sorting domain-containing protein [Litoribacter alkaliphilus]|uniref:T9SS type A sorting domain-containing protein n=1 Tax=Litoribacter ruber TaxID=702568 RepID=A0AAP2G443_9BACT|nr:choice-of-anchor tandem repeat GloVer-containing protein [Litoribacter alkaliphilus]MBS9524135.1 T9SS type A sorting domain-containing protein [Litoribacter alkaliphilus]